MSAGSRTTNAGTDLPVILVLVATKASLVEVLTEAVLLVVASVPMVEADLS